MIWLLIAALFAAPTPRRGQRAPSAAGAPESLSDEEIARRANGYLGSIDTPISAEQWRALGPRAATVLEPIIGDRNALPTRRAKAIDGLVAAAPSRAAQLVGKLARDETEPVVVRVAALHGARRALPSAKLIAELKPVLESARDPGLRGVAAEVITHAKGGCAAVRARLEREGADERAAYDRALRRCGE
ncbi:MAG: hypothetical protein E6J78_08865 [Deltaproteobacteria bacterium]|nr:MAG: hypothetical protein E6J78_08865 [Deltaproteobacteria bacterium]